MVSGRPEGWAEQGQLAIETVSGGGEPQGGAEGKPAARELGSKRVRVKRATDAENVAVLPTARRTSAKLELQLEVTDPEVIGELMRIAEGEPRERYALAALRLGVLSLRMASGQVDAGSIREAGQTLMMEIGGMLESRAQQLTQEVESELRQYFDPSNGAFSQRIRALVEKDGELERVLRSHLGPDESVLARTLASHLGEGSAVFKMLSPSEADGLLAQLAGTLEGALKEQREQLLQEFSLNNKESALSRLVGEIAVGHGELKTDLKGQIDAVVKEFSLNEPNSALSRLVGRVDATQKTIADQFSSDNEQSALSRLSRLLQSTSDQIGNNLTLDDDKSALSRLKRELETSIGDLVQRNLAFHSEVRETLAKLQGSKQEAARSTRHGLTFEEQLGTLLSAEAQRLGDVYQAVGATTGMIKNRKRGDHVIELGSESAAAGARLVWEAKEDKSYDLRGALLEMDEARKNRDAQLGVFVFSKKTVPEGQQPFVRYGQDLVVVWDAEDTTTDLYVTAAYSVARALAVRTQQETGQNQEALQEIQLATRVVEKQLQHLEEINTWGKTVQSNGEKISERAEKMKKDLFKEIERLDAQVEVLRGMGPS